MTHSTEPHTHPKRPLSVWILTIFAFLFAGLIPFLNTLGAVISGHFFEQPLTILILLPVCFGAAVTAVGAWQGRMSARRHFINFVVIYFLTIAIGHVVLLFSGKLAESQHTTAYAIIARGIIFAVIYLYYFNLPSTMVFYKESESLRQKPVKGMGGSSSESTSCGNQPAPHSLRNEIIGVYPIQPTAESIITAARYHGYTWCIGEDGKFADPIYPDNFKNLCLIELKIRGDFSKALLGKITQHRPDERTGEGQVPYMEFYLDSQGQRLISENEAPDTGERRICFFLHFVDPAIPLTVGDESLPLPPATQLPARLQPFTHYVPVD